MKRRLLSRAAWLAAASVGSIALAQVNGTWTSLDGGTWSTAANWSSAPLTPGGGGIATFGPANWNTTTITIDQNVTLSQLNLFGTSRRHISGGGVLTLVGPAIINASGPIDTLVNRQPHTIAAPLVSNAGLVKNGPGAVGITSMNITGGITINDGALILSGASPLANVSGGITLNGGTLTSGFGATLTEPIHIAPAGGTIIGQGQGDFRIDGSVEGSGDLEFGPGFYGVTLRSDSPITGAVKVGGSLLLRSAGALNHVSSITIDRSLRLDNVTDGVVSGNRISDTAPIEFNGGTISTLGNSASPVVEQIGTVTVRRGISSILASDSLMIAMAALSRDNRAILNLGAGTSGTAIQLAGTAPALSGSGAPNTPDVGILRWAVAGAAPVTVDAGIIRPLHASEYINAAPAGVSMSNWRQSGDVSLASAVTVNSLTLTSGVLSGPGAVSVTSGAVFIQNVAILTAPLDFGSSEGIIHSTLFTSINGNPVVESDISGSNGLTIAGSFTLRGHSTYTGTTTIHGTAILDSDVVGGAAGPLGSDSSPVIVESGGAGAGLLFRANSAMVTFARDLVTRSVGDGSVNLANSGTSAFATEITGNIDASGTLSLSGNLHISGDISGSAVLRTNGAVTLSGNNTFTGGVMKIGRLRVASDTALGAGPLWITAEMEAVGQRTLANPVIVGRSPRLIGDFTFTGPVDLSSGLGGFYIPAGSITRLLGPVYGGGLAMDDGGTLEIASLRLPAVNIYRGLFKLLPGGDGAAYTKALTLNSVLTGKFDLTDNDLIVDYADISPFASIRAWILDGRLFSSFADASHGLGYLDNATTGLATFSGQLVDETSILIKYTLFGDADLDGDVDGIDVGSWAQNFTGDLGGAGTLSWSDGDWDYDGDVDGVDVGLWAGNFTGELGGAGLSDVTVAWPGNPQAARLLRSLGITLVPEPGTCAAIFAGAAILASRMRRRGV